MRPDRAAPLAGPAPPLGPERPLMTPTRALVSDARGGFQLETIEVGPPGPGEVAVEMLASGVCHTDHDSMRWPYPVVLGHEGAGRVTAIGQGVSRCSVGDRVLLNWAMPCGSCLQCQRGRQNLCEQNNPVTADDGPLGRGHADRQRTQWKHHPIPRSFNLGTMSERTVVREEAVIPISVDIPSTSACILGCGVMTGYGSVVHAARVRPGSSCVVLGAGGVGLNVIQACRISGAGTVIAVDVKESRMEMARQFGAKRTLLAERDDADLGRVAAQVQKMTRGGADFAFECTAVPALGAAPLAMVRNGGVAVQVSGIEEDLTIDMRLFEWDKTYINPLYGQCRPDLDFPTLLQLYDKGELLLDELVSRTYRLEQAEQAFADLLAGRNAKGVFVFDEPA